MNWKLYMAVTFIAVVIIAVIVVAYQFAPASLSPDLDGASLYSIHCSSCHEPLESSEKRGATSAQIYAAIASVSRMQSLSNLTSAEIEAIAAALSSP